MISLPLSISVLIYAIHLVNTSIKSFICFFRDMKLIYSPNDEPFQDIMRFFGLIIEDVIPVNDTNELITKCEEESHEKICVGIEFVVNKKNPLHLKEIHDFEVLIR